LYSEEVCGHSARSRAGNRAERYSIGQGGGNFGVSSSQFPVLGTDYWLLATGNW